MRQNTDAAQMILYEDREILVCHKAAGIPVQSAGVRTPDLQSILMNYLGEKQQGTPYLGIVHRLDQNVEGIVVFAKNKKAAAALSAQMTGGGMEKIYLAVCCDAAAAGFRQQGSLEDALKKDARTNTSSIVPEHTPGAKLARLRYELLRETEMEGKRYGLAKITLLTGRHHQIRVQMAGAGMPLYGDMKYNRAWEAFLLPGQGRQVQPALCAVSLSFDAPVRSGRRMKFEIRPSGSIFGIFGEDL